MHSAERHLFSLNPYPRSSNQEASEVYRGPSRKQHCVEKQEEAEALPILYRIASLGNSLPNQMGCVLFSPQGSAGLQLPLLREVPQWPHDKLGRSTVCLSTLQCLLLNTTEVTFC